MSVIFGVLENNTTSNGVVTDENGKFTVESLAPGRYNLRVSYLGYETVTIPNILVTSGKEMILDITMEESINTIIKCLLIAV